MILKISQQYFIITLLACTLLHGLFEINVEAQEINSTLPGNFGLPGVIDLPTAKNFPDGELVISQQIHKSLARSGISFQALPRVGVSFRYSGHGIGGQEAHGRINHDRSFDIHLSILDEKTYLPAISLGLRDFIGTGWYSSEYIVGTKSLGNLEVTAGLGFGRLAGRNQLSNPLRNFSDEFVKRQRNQSGKGGTLGTINWFQGNTSVFYGANYYLDDKISLSLEYTPDLMLRENSYLKIKSPWNFGLAYQINRYSSFAAHYLHGSQLSLTAHVKVNPSRPPFNGGRDLAPVPMRLRGNETFSKKQHNEETIRNVLAADKFLIHRLQFQGKTVELDITNTKFRSIAQAIGRASSTLQRFTSDKTQIALVTFYDGGLKVGSYRVDLQKITVEQFNPIPFDSENPSIYAIDPKPRPFQSYEKRFTWGVGPYFEHRLFNPDLPLSMEVGLEVESGFQLAPGLKLTGAIRKSILTNLTDNKRRSNSALPRVHSDWALYDLSGQSGHIKDLTVSYTKNLAPRVFARIHAGLLEPFFAGIGGEILYKHAQSPFAVGIDIHRVKKRNYDMRFSLRDYETTVGHFNFYHDVGRMFDLEINAGRYLAGDWGVTTTISRKFRNGWEVGGYATLTDVPFDTFGEGSFDKAIYVSIPIDWIISAPNQTKRRLTIRPITRDGGAHLASARKLYKQIESSQSAEFHRELGRLWK